MHDVMLSVETGADAVGMIFAPSPRRIAESAAKDIARELPPFITPVGVFVNPTYDEIIRARSIFPDLVIQLSGTESPTFVSSLEGKLIKAVHVLPEGESEEALASRADHHPRAIILFDTKVEGVAGGTGLTFAWRSIAPIARRRQVMVGGGLNPENVSSCVRTVRPYGVDVRSGIESEGRKDPAKMRAFVQAVKDTDVA
ncbi:MAG: phosphoribosylanthranilate isomerase [Candidatus Eremiobacteraeota bacterium]|nr:phosphoribosylanthranilate isomerase [Candidatus Eremiobacteraeota bacterium]